MVVCQIVFLMFSQFHQLDAGGLCLFFVLLLAVGVQHVTMLPFFWGGGGVSFIHTVTMTVHVNL